ncbi:MAG: hypothetical protein KC419_03645 [Anaerolineales bacterium]|nr:hypothetical protein [Anaerolineales bacterium]
MKRWFIVVGLLGMLAAVGLSACGALSGASSTDLSNSVGSENGPGSGKWNPPKPENNKQARQLYDVLQILAKNANEDAAAYDARYIDCFDSKGNLLPGKEEEECAKPLMELIASLQKYYTDFGAGWRVYHGYGNEIGEDLPSVADLLKPPSNDPLQDLSVPGWTGCLTCTYGIAPEYVFHPVEIALSSN